MRKLLGLVRHFRVLWAHRRARPLFDPEFYLRRYPDVAAAGADPWLHYLLHGAAEGRKPHPLFDSNYYLIQRAKTADALMDFIEPSTSGWANPHPLFDCESYARAHPDAANGINPLLRYLRSRRGEAAAPEGGYFGAT